MTLSTDPCTAGGWLV